MPNYIENGLEVASWARLDTALVRIAKGHPLSLSFALDCAIRVSRSEVNSNAEFLSALLGRLKQQLCDSESSNVKITCVASPGFCLLPFDDTTNPSID